MTGEAAAMLNTPLSQLERDVLVEFTGPEHCLECRADPKLLCSHHAVTLRYEATVRAVLNCLPTSAKR